MNGLLPIIRRARRPLIDPDYRVAVPVPKETDVPNKKPSRTVREKVGGTKELPGALPGTTEPGAPE